MAPTKASIASRSSAPSQTSSISSPHFTQAPQHAQHAFRVGGASVKGKGDQRFVFHEPRCTDSRQGPAGAGPEGLCDRNLLADHKTLSCSAVLFCRGNPGNFHSRPHFIHKFIPVRKRESPPAAHGCPLLYLQDQWTPGSRLSVRSSRSSTGFLDHELLSWPCRTPPASSSGALFNYDILRGHFAYAELPSGRIFTRMKRSSLESAVSFRPSGR